MKGNWPVSMEVEKAKEINADFKEWGYTREDFVTKWHAYEKEMRAKELKKPAKRSA